MSDIRVLECSYPNCTKNSHYMIEKGGDFYPFCKDHGDKAKSYLGGKENEEKL